MEFVWSNIIYVSIIPTCFNVTHECKWFVSVSMYNNIGKGAKFSPSLSPSRLLLSLFYISTMFLLGEVIVNWYSSLIKFSLFYASIFFIFFLRSMTAELGVSPACGKAEWGNINYFLTQGWWRKKIFQIILSDNSAFPADSVERSQHRCNERAKKTLLSWGKKVEYSKMLLRF